MHHSPSGAEAEINQFLMQGLAALDVEVWCVIPIHEKYDTDKLGVNMSGRKWLESLK
ncbi:hypothetical protein [Nostoc sp.]|uniref:hypothetical protein n=1 Tax=Nostoc sp. TaxID=1180 RepID=UPI003FA5EAAB